ncbi:MAG: hypothetical protein M3Q32_05260 [Pseudomonadota bacterium]|nr:hypothetical protein [Pseudomonadota bacterium]
MAQVNTEANTVYSTGAPQNLASKRVSWAAVLAGVILAMVTQLLLSMLGTGIGSTVDPLQGETPGAATLGIGAGIWWAVSSLIALFIGGWVAAHLAGIPRKVDGVLHGLLTWGLSTLIILYLLGTAVGSVLGGAFNLVGGVASTAAQGVVAAAPEVADAAQNKLAESGISLDDIKREARQLLSQTGKPELQPEALEQNARAAAGRAGSAAQDAAQKPMAADQELDGLLAKLMRQGKSVASAADREAVVNVLVARGMSQEEAAKTVDNWQQTYQQAQAKMQDVKSDVKQDARAVADQTADAVSKGALWGFFALLLGAIAAAIGGAMGRPRTVIVA